jgi:hypothetical protein
VAARQFGWLYRAGSVIGRSSHTAGRDLRLRVASLGGDQVELLLGLIEPQPDSLLVQQPQIAADRGVDKAKLVELSAELADAKTKLTMGFVQIVDALGQALVTLLERLADIGETRIDVATHVLDSLQQQLMALDALRLDAAYLLPHRGVRLPQLFQ